MIEEKKHQNLYKKSYICKYLFFLRPERAYLSTRVAYASRALLFVDLQHSAKRSKICKKKSVNTGVKIRDWCQANKKNSRGLDADSLISILQRDFSLFARQCIGVKDQR
jgi:hypothetical protein